MQKPSSITDFFYNFALKKREVILFPLRDVVPQIPRITKIAQNLENTNKTTRYIRNKRQTRHQLSKKSTEIYQSAQKLITKYLSTEKNPHTPKTPKTKNPTEKIAPKHPQKAPKKWQKIEQEYNLNTERYGTDFCYSFLHSILADIKQNITDLDVFCNEIKKGQIAKTLPKTTSNAFFYGVAQKNPRATQIILCGNVDISREISAFVEELEYIECRLLNLVALVNLVNCY